jgi:hypothetical protein
MNATVGCLARPVGFSAEHKGLVFGPGDGSRRPELHGDRCV